MTLYYKTRGEHLANGQQRWYAYHWTWLGMLPWKAWVPLSTHFNGFRTEAFPVGRSKEEAREVCERDATGKLSQMRAARDHRVVSKLQGEHIAIEEPKP